MLPAAALVPSVLRSVRVRRNAPGGRPASRLAATTDAVFRHAAHFVEAMGIMRSLPRMVSFCAFSTACWGCEGMAFVVLAAGLDTGAGPFGPWMSLAAGSLATAIPDAPGHIGAFHYFAALGLAAYGAGPDVPAALALGVHTLLWLPLTASDSHYGDGRAFLGASLPSRMREQAATGPPHRSRPK